MTKIVKFIIQNTKVIVLKLTLEMVANRGYRLVSGVKIETKIRSLLNIYVIFVINFIFSFL